MTTEEWKAGLEALESQELHRRLSLVDPNMATRLHPHNKRKIIRSVEWSLQQGQHWPLKIRGSYLQVPLEVCFVPQMPTAPRGWVEVVNCRVPPVIEILFNCYGSTWKNSFSILVHTF